MPFESDTIPIDRRNIQYNILLYCMECYFFKYEDEKKVNKHMDY